MHLLIYRLTVLAVFVADTAGSTITGDEEANGAAVSTPSVLSRTNVTLPVTLRTGTSHDDAGIETDDEGQHDVEERTVASLQQVEEAAPALVDHVAALLKRDDAILSPASQKITKEKAVEDELRDLSETLQKEEGVWDYKIVAESLVSTESRGQELQAEVEGAVNALLKLRKDPGMKTHADRIHRELFFMYRKRLDESLVKVYLNARVTPEEFLDMMWGEKELYLADDVFDMAKIKVFDKALKFLENKYSSVFFKGRYTNDAIKSIETNVRNKFESLVPHMAPETKYT